VLGGRGGVLYGSYRLRQPSTKSDVMIKKKVWYRVTGSGFSEGLDAVLYQTVGRGRRSVRLEVDFKVSSDLLRSLSSW
jgi:hypothetical protein